MHGLANPKIDAQVFERIIKIYIKTAATCFGVTTIIRERTIRAR
jgi:hypothetical protein